MLTLKPELITLLDSFLAFSYSQTLKTLLVYKQYSSYINNRLASTINKTIELLLIVIRAIEKRDKGAKAILLKGVLVEKEL